ncbi:MAG: c-type cytochrome [Gammaproteobacteria bacterium]
MRSRKPGKIALLISAVSLGLLVAHVAAGVPVKERELDWVLKRTPDKANGAKLYETCAACHGNSGEGVSDGTVPVIGGQSAAVIAKQIVDFRAGTRREPRMEHFTDVHHLAYSQHIADVSAYVATLTPAVTQRKFSTEVIGRGSLLFARSCERCHGTAGEGNEDELTPRMASQHFEYLVRQLDRSATEWRPAMPEKHATLVSRVSRDDLTAIATYLSSVGGP